MVHRLIKQATRLASELEKFPSPDEKQRITYAYSREQELEKSRSKW
uniref:Uncharacterized protein n=1 Tax=Zea mays TaxID=4577 RepID=C4J1Z3_MAIZE|nr:unknown [Zea mays]